MLSGVAYGFQEVSSGFLGLLMGFSKEEVFLISLVIVGIILCDCFQLWFKGERSLGVKFTPQTTGRRSVQLPAR